MSRTDKDRPRWVRVRDPDTPVSVVHDHTAGRCDAHVQGERRNGVSCYWESPPWVRRDSALPPPPNRIARLEWWTPDRTRERDALHGMARTYNADPAAFLEDDDADFENRLGRHGVRYDFW